MMRRLRQAKTMDSTPMKVETAERLFTLLNVRYPGHVWRVIEVCPVSVVKTIDNETDALTTIANLERTMAAQT